MRSDQLQKWALGAEIAGALAVVITLGFLAFQMRENTNAVQAQTYQALMEELNNYRALTVDPGLAEVEGKFRVGGWQGLTRVEKLQLRSRANIRWAFTRALTLQTSEACWVSQNGNDSSMGFVVDFWRMLTYWNRKKGSRQ